MQKPRALVSVSDKAGIIEFCRGLADRGFEILSTGGTLKALSAQGIPARQVCDATGMPEILGGRLKTLHPVIFGGILARRNEAGDMDALAEHGIGPVDVVAVNLYPFGKTLENPASKDEELIEQIDIGGPSLLRAAAKNHHDVYVVVDPADYEQVLSALDSNRSADYRSLRRKLAGKVFQHTADYDALIAGYMSGPARGSEDAEGCSCAEPHPLPQTLNIRWPMRQTLRYGENPHQIAGFYADPAAQPPSMAHCRQLQGKELSYNNYLDGETALEMVREFEKPACVILKHSNPCGAAWGGDCLEAYKLALSTDPTSAFGGIIGVNRPMDGALAQVISPMFMEVIIAPSFSPEAEDILGKKKNLRLLECGPLHPRTSGLTMRSIAGGMLVQDADTGRAARSQMKVVTEKQPTEEDWQGLEFAWLCCKWVKSNAIVFTDRQKTLGVGAGQMSRVDATKLAINKAVANLKKSDDPAQAQTQADKHPVSIDASAARGVLGGSYLGSDAFFPFRDVVDLAAQAGAKALIQPGGSIRDEESIQACNEQGLIMVFTGMRHFRH